MKQIILIGLIVILSQTQTIITSKTDACECVSLLNQADCITKSGCTWKFNTIYNSTLQTSNQSTTSGTCTNETITAIIQIPTYCKNVINILQCSSTIGCALVNNTCTIFAGCYAYNKTTNAACQAISKQCTTDGIRCILPTACLAYETQELCTKNIASSGAKSCNWNSDNGGKCEDKKCSDAPRTIKTQQQCNNWINGCLSNGIGCTQVLSPCNSYQQINGCIGMVGSDGPCMANAGSNQCRPLVCTDAPQIYQTIKACDAFLKGCITNGKGCVESLSSCNTYTQKQGCAGILGSDGPCTVNRTRGSINCRALACNDAPASANTNASCSKFLNGCVTTGHGCTNQLLACSSYQGTITTCSSQIGSDGKCRGKSTQVDQCVARTCQDAPATTNTNSACAQFQIGCVTTGVGCTNQLESCISYTGTNITCQQYIGNDGNCTAPLTQETPAPCVAKVCKDAPKTITSNQGCTSFSYQCVTNGAGCINQTTCESTELAISCSGQSDCVLNQICLNRSSCSNYLTKSQCLLNKQQYHYQGVQSNIYLRPCQWSESTQSCQNNICSDLPNNLTTDAACNSALQGCLTNGAGCIDISEPCPRYRGLTVDCQKFKGLGGIQQCSQVNTVTDPNASCILMLFCYQANSLSLIPQTSNETCNSFLKGCFFDGKDNCTRGEDCTSYYGTQNQCASITTALNGLTPQACWKTVNLNDATTPCEVRFCYQASASFNTDALCNSFLKGCKWNGLESGGCITPQSICQQYKGTLSTCSTFYDQQNRQCTKTSNFCKPLYCTTKIPPPTAITPILKGIYCQKFIEYNGGYNCQGANTSCVDPQPQSCSSFVAIGQDNDSKVKYCYSLKYPYPGACGYTNEDFCTSAQCDQFTASGLNAGQKATYCENLTTDGTQLCGLASSTATQCSIRSCTDYGSSTQAQCQSYIAGSQCNWNQMTNSCYSRQPVCAAYIIPLEYQQTELLKAKYCGSLISTTVGCTYFFQSPVNCSAALSVCTDITFPSSIQSDQDKATFCANSKIQDGFTACAYSTDAQSTCAVLASCNAYIAYQGASTNTDLMNQIFCQTLKDFSGIICGFTSGLPYCIPPSMDCAYYDTYGESIAQNHALCSQLSLGFNNLKKCSSNTSGVSKCKEVFCGDVQTGQSFETCRTYNIGCTFDGISCVSLNPDCTAYVAQIQGQGQQYNCAALSQPDGTKCGWSNGANCSVRSCAQIFGPDANPINCKDYLYYCQYDGNSCVDMAPSCTAYTPFGATDSEKAQICNSLNSQWYQKCTYFVGSVQCVNTIPGCLYTLSQPFTYDQALAYCSLAQDQQGQKCTYQIGDLTCSTRRVCYLAQMASSDADCNNYLKGCDQDTTSFCSSTNCSSAPTTIKTNADCAAYRFGCLTNGAGCVEPTAPCTAYKGTRATCNGFIGNNSPCTNYQSASSNDNCISRTCVLNTIASSNEECAAWYPPKYGNVNCVWGGTLGCVPPQNCAAFIGTVDSCPKFIAQDGPCSGTGSFIAPKPCISNNSICSHAPKTYNTHIQCSSWGLQCMTNGNGCTSKYELTCQNIQTTDACLIYSSFPEFYCSLAQQCKTRPSYCGMIMTGFECNNTLLTGSDKLTCGWNGLICVTLNCELLPVTLTTDIQCSASILNCTTNGAGCITKDACSTYSKQACSVASTTDIQKVCIWQNSACRPIECKDNTTATSDAECNKFLEGCRTPGLGCLSYMTCSVITKPELCLFDSFKNPCLWYKSSPSATGSCVYFSQCSDIISSSHQECQAASPLCTTNGNNCIAITTCSKTISQASCIIGIDGKCGWKQDDLKCDLYTNCQSYVIHGYNNNSCQIWGPNCITDGKSCIEKSTCTSYFTQTSCNIGTDGKCYWNASTEDASIGTCRQQVCQDATFKDTDITTHTGCVTFQASTACTTSGVGCINQALCSSYTVQVACVQGTDGQCIWATQQNTSICRLKQCTDSLLTQSAQCKQEIPGVKCVSNGTNCIPQSTCSSYTARETCLGGGSDGVCAFNPGANITTPNIGTCSLFTQCSIANYDQIACNSRNDACYFNQTTINGTTTSQCIPHTCATKAQGTSCQPIPSWDLSQYQICVLSGTTCTQGNPNQLTSQNCYNNSVGTYSWNINTSSCTACIKKNSSNNTEVIDSLNCQLVRVCLLIILII